jgi:hypothetical protein
MAKGDVDSIVVRQVDVTEASATLDIIAAFTDGTYADGAMTLIKSGGNWYFYSMSGLRIQGRVGFSSSVKTAADVESSHTIEAGMQVEGVTTFDQGILTALYAEQAKQQTLITQVIAGKYNAIRPGKPGIGANTIVLPVSLTGPKSARAHGRVVMVQKDIDGKLRTFLLSLSPE